ncbi:MAG: helix-turn-helix domain-containing protein, partial [Amphritea sp.]
DILASESFVSEIVDLIIRQKEKEAEEKNEPNFMGFLSTQYLNKKNVCESDFVIFKQSKAYSEAPKEKIVTFIVEISQSCSKENLTENQLKHIFSIFIQSGFKDDFFVNNNGHQLVALLKVGDRRRELDLSTTLRKIEIITERLSQLSWLKFFVACGNYYDGTDKIQTSYQSALKTLSIGKALHPEKEIYLYTDMALDVLLLENRDNWSSKHMFNTYENLTYRDKKNCLKKTLHSLFCSNLNISKAAENLNIHRNTLRHRLDKIKELTGLDVTDLNNLFILYSAFRLNELNKVNEIN